MYSNLVFFVFIYPIFYRPTKQIPEEITKVPDLKANQVTELSASARTFLLNLAQIAHNESERPIEPTDSDSASEVEDSLTWDALKVVLSVLSSDTEYPWHDPPSYKVRSNMYCMGFFSFTFL